MVESINVSVNNNNLSVGDIDGDGKINEEELLSAISTYNESQTDEAKKITGNLELSYTSNDNPFADDVADGKIDTEGEFKDAAVAIKEPVVETPEEEEDPSLEEQLADAGVKVYTAADGELIIYAETAEELAAVKKVLEANGLDYDVTATTKTEAEIKEYLDGTLTTDFPEGVTKGTGDDYADMMADGIMNMSFYDEATGTDVTYQITDQEAIDQFKTWLETDTTVDPGTSTTVTATEVQAALVSAGALEEDATANIDSIMANLVTQGYLTEADGVYTKTDTWPTDAEGASAMVADIATPGLESMAENAGLETEELLNAFVKNLTGVDPAGTRTGTTVDSAEVQAALVAAGASEEDATANLDAVMAGLVEAGYLTEADGVYTKTETWPDSEESQSAMSTALQSLPEVQAMAENAGIELEEFTVAFVIELTGFEMTEDSPILDSAEVQAALVSAGASEEDSTANLDAVMAGLVEAGYLTELEGVYTKTDTWPAGYEGNSAMSTALQSLPEVQTMAENAGLAVDEFADAFVLSLAGDYLEI